MTRLKGFTLVEILIVMGLMGLVLTLVGPLLQHQVEKADASAEFIEARQYINNSGKVAFLQNKQVFLVFDGKVLTRKMAGHHEEVEYNHLFFPKQELIFNPHGYTDSRSIQVVAGRRHLEIELTGQVKP